MSDFDTLAARYRELSAQRDALDAEMQNIREEFAVEGPSTKKSSDGSVIVTVSRPARRFDVTLAQKVIPSSLLPSCTEQVISPKKAKENLPKDVYEQCQKESNSGTVRVSLVEVEQMPDLTGEDDEQVVVIADVDDGSDDDEYL